MELTDENFNEQISKLEKPVLVDFYAAWCQPCAMLGPVLQKVADEYKDKIIFAKVDLETAPITAQKYGIDRIPAVLLFKQRKPVSGFMGAQPEAAIKQWLNRELEK